MYIYVCMYVCMNGCQLLAVGWWFSPGTPASSTNKTGMSGYNLHRFKRTLNTKQSIFSRTAGWIDSKHGTDVLHKVPYKCCYFSGP